MCVIIHKPSDVDINEHVLKACWDENKDGAGIMYALNDELRIIKGLMKFKHLMSFYKKLKHLELLIHFRYATHGMINKEMTHPFKINDNLAFMHNGIIHLDSMESSLDVSDSYVFNESILKKLPVNFINNEAIIDLISYRINRSVLVFMDNKGIIKKINNNLKYIIFDGCWFSNPYWMLNDDLHKYVDVSDYIMSFCPEHAEHDEHDEQNQDGF